MFILHKTRDVFGHHSKAIAADNCMHILHEVTSLNTQTLRVDARLDSRNVMPAEQRASPQPSHVQPQGGKLNDGSRIHWSQVQIVRCVTRALSYHGRLAAFNTIA